MELVQNICTVIVRKLAVVHAGNYIIVENSKKCIKSCDSQLGVMAHSENSALHKCLALRKHAF